MMNMQILNLIKGANNPQQMAMNLLKQRCGNNPLLQNVFNMANNGNVSGIESIARNMCNANGVNADEMIKQIKSMM